MKLLTVLKITGFRNLWLSQAISQVFLNLLFFSLMIQIYQVSGSNSAVSWLVLLVTLPNIFLGALAGVFVDRIGRKTVMFLAHFLRVFAVLGFLFSPETISWIYLLALSISTISQFFFPAEAGTIYELVEDPDLLLTANSLFSITFFGSVILGNVLAGPFLKIFGPSGTFLITSVAFLIAALCILKTPGKLFAPTVLGKTKADINVLFSDLMVGLDHIYHRPVVQKAILAMGASQISIGVIGAIAPGFADKVLGLEPSDVSLFIMAPAALGMAMGAFIVGQFFAKTNRQKLVKFGFLAASFMLLIYSFVDRAPFLNIPILLLLGAGNAFLDIPVNTIIQESTPDKVRSRVYGVVASVIGLASIFPVVLSGTIADMFGARTVMFLMGAILFILGIITYNRIKTYDADSN